MSNVVLTPSALLAFLNEIDELKDKEINFHESDDKISISIDDNTYVLDASDAIEVLVDEQSYEEVETANEDGYEEIGEDVEEIESDEIESGIIKELIKTLALGGLVKMTKHALEKA